MAIANLLNQISYSFNMIHDVSEKKIKKGGRGGTGPLLGSATVFLVKEMQVVFGLHLIC